MRLKYLDIELKRIDAIPPKGVNFFSRQSEFGGADCIRPWMTDLIFGVSDGQGYGTNIRGENYAYRSETFFPMKYKLNEIIGINGIHKSLIAINPTEEAQRAIAAVLKVVKVKDQLFIGPIYMDINVGYKGTCIYCDNKVIAFYDEANKSIVSTPITEGTDYKELFSNKAKDVTKNKETYKFCIDKSINKLAQVGQNEVRQVVSSFKGAMTSTKAALNKDKTQYHRTKIGLKKIKEGLDIPELSGFVEEVKKKATDFVKQYDLNVKSYANCATKIKDATETENFIKESNSKSGQDYALVKKLLKKGVIEDITFHKGVLSWTYPPTTYDTKDGGYGLRFLGRVRVLLNKDQSVEIDAISYPSDETYGTYHFYGVGTNDACLGQFNEVVYRLIAGKRIADLILVMRDYIQSCNTKSKKCNPNWDNMSLDNPKVIDDSFEVWKSRKGVK